MTIILAPNTGANCTATASISINNSNNIGSMIASVWKMVGGAVSSMLGLNPSYNNVALASSSDLTKDGALGSKISLSINDMQAFVGNCSVGLMGAVPTTLNATLSCKLTSLLDSSTSVCNGTSGFVIINGALSVNATEVVLPINLNGTNYDMFNISQTLHG